MHHWRDKIYLITALLRILSVSIFHYYHYQILPFLNPSKMATLLPPKSKRQKKESLNPTTIEIPEKFPLVNVQFRASDDSNELASLLVPGNSSVRQLEALLNQLLENVRMKIFFL